MSTRHSVWLFVGLVLPGGLAAAEKTVEFNRDIRPILANNCYACHGPDSGQRKGDLRLDREEDAFAKREAGHFVLVPGDLKKSELFFRITAKDEFQMPPKKSRKVLTPGQIELVRKWIEQGAKYQQHWSLIAPKRSPVPDVDAVWGRDPIDRFLLARMKSQGLKPSARADARTLIRRLTFDLNGLPPTIEEVGAFVQAMEQNPDKAYEELVDRLLASPHYGERMAIYWLDLVRYADTNGIHGDNHHDIALYRDYVIRAFNRNTRFDTFTIEQLGGDLLPGATLEQKIASGYNRLNMVTREGGAQAKEYRAKYAADRVRNASTVWLGATLGCAECHDHKFDAFTQKDFYSFAAFFADLQETAVGVQPAFTAILEEQKKRIAKIDKRLGELQKQLATTTPELAKAQEKWEAEVKTNKGKGVPKNIFAIIQVEPDKRNPGQENTLAGHYRNIAPALRPARDERGRLQKEKQQIQKSAPKTLISMAGKPRMMRVLPRGDWLSDSGEVVEPDVPGSLPGLNVKDRRANRLDLAKWFVADENPMVSRVFVNRMWKLLFGRGIVSTLDDLGTQGTWPSHPDLLDWLAVEFREGGWDVKKLLKTMVMTNAYRQSSRVSKETRAKDPYNIWLSRQGRFRLDAEMIRDNALLVSGLLVDRVGGPSVKPYQPSGYWAHLNFPKRVYVHDKNENQYRRGVYTYWCRTFLHPALLAFDAPTREESCVDRPRSNTPLQALVLLNDPSFVEAARKLAERVVAEGGKSVRDRIAFGYRTVLQREPLAREIQLLTKLQADHHAHYKAHIQEAEKLLGVGLAPSKFAGDKAKLAAWTSVARVLLNLHETITRN